MKGGKHWIRDIEKLLSISVQKRKIRYRREEAERGKREKTA